MFLDILHSSNLNHCNKQNKYNFLDTRFKTKDCQNKSSNKPSISYSIMENTSYQNDNNKIDKIYFLSLTNNENQKDKEKKLYYKQNNNCGDYNRYKNDNQYHNRNYNKYECQQCYENNLKKEFFIKITVSLAMLNLMILSAK